jgi:hypothetical protein
MITVSDRLFIYKDAPPAYRPYVEEFTIWSKYVDEIAFTVLERR